jgi:sugar lactone lactonase YvrE
VVTGICIDKHNNIFFTDNGRIRTVTAATTIITTVAGNGANAYSGDGGQATAASINYAADVALDTAGNIYITDYYSNRVRMVSKATGIITTVAGNGAQGYIGDGGQATGAEFYYPQGIAVDDSGNMYIGDKMNNVIRKVKASTGIISTYAGNGTQTYSGDGSAATATGLAPTGCIALDTARNLYITDTKNYRVYMVNAKTGIITTLAGNGTRGNGGNTGPATNASLSAPTGVFVDKAGDIYIVDQNADCVRVVNGTTHIITLAAYN